MRSRILLNMLLALALASTLAMASGGIAHAASSDCVPTTTIPGGWGWGGTPGLLEQGVFFTVSCDAVVRVHMDIVDANGKLVWRQYDQHYQATSSAENTFASDWYFHGNETADGTHSTWTIYSANGQVLLARWDLG